MQRPAFAAQTRCPAPKMTAAGTRAAGFKRVPRGVAAAEIKFRVTAINAPPTARFRRLPFTKRTANAAEIVFFLQFCELVGNFFRRSFLKE